MKNQSKNQKKLFVGLIITGIIAILLGLFFVAILKIADKELIKTTITNFMKQVKTQRLFYQEAMIQSILGNTIKEVLLFFLGLSIIGLPIIFIIYLSQAFTLGFSISSILYVYKWKGILLSLIYCTPLIINLLIFLILSYYALLFSKYLFYHLFLKKELSFKKIMKRYIKVFGIGTICLLLSSLIEVFLIPKLLAFLL